MATSDVAWLKEFLDGELFGVLLKGWDHKMTLTTLLGEGNVALVFLESGAFADDVIGLLEHGAKIDHFRNPLKVGDHTLFGGDGMPTLLRADNEKGAARARLLHVVHPRSLIIEVRRVSENINGAVRDAQAFYDTLEKRLGVKPEEIVKKYGAV